MAVERLVRRSTSGCAYRGRNPCTNVENVSFSRRWDSAAIVSNTSDDFPEPETPVKTVIFRRGISTEMFLRLFARAPRTSMLPNGELMKLAGLLAARSPGLWLALALEIERHCSADKIFQSALIESVALGKINRSPSIPIQAGVEELVRIGKACALSKGQFYLVLVSVAHADYPVVRPTRTTHPLPFLNDLGIRLVYDFAHFREGLSAPVPQFLDLRVDDCRGRFRRDGFLHICSNLVAILAVLPKHTFNPSRRRPASWVPRRRIALRTRLSIAPSRRTSWPRRQRCGRWEFR